MYNGNGICQKQTNCTFCSNIKDVLPEGDDSLITSNEIFNEAERLVSKCGTRNPLKIADEIGIKVLHCKFEDLLGMYTCRLKNRIIILNDNLSYYSEQIVAAHELGHDRLHRELAKEGGFKEFGLLNIKHISEYEANAFAAHLLMNNEDVEYLMKRESDIYTVAKLLCMNPDLLLIKVREMNKLGYNIPLPLEYNNRFFVNSF